MRLKPVDKAVLGMVGERLGRTATDRKVFSKGRISGGRALDVEAKAE